MSISGLQQNLKAKGLYTGKVDGLRGPMTLQGLAEYLTDGAAPADTGQLLAKWLPVGHINNRLRLIHFMAQAAHESAFAPRVENLNYSVQALLTKFGRHRISEADARRFGRIDGVQKANQVEIANRIYGGEFGRTQLGNVNPGDGWRMRGKGVFQITGLRNHVLYGFGSDPEALLTPDGSMHGAVAFWDDKGCNELADLDNTYAITLRVNGGTNGIDDRRAKVAKAKAIFPA